MSRFLQPDEKLSEILPEDIHKFNVEAADVGTGYLRLTWNDWKHCEPSRARYQGKTSPVSVGRLSSARRKKQGNKDAE